TFGPENESPRRAIYGDRRRRHPSFRYSLLKQRTQILQRARNHPIGDFFGADFEEERKTARWAGRRRRHQVGIREFRVLTHWRLGMSGWWPLRARPIANRPQDSILPHKEIAC